MHRVQRLWPLATYVAWFVCLFVCVCVSLSVGHTNMHPTKMDEPIKVLFGMQTQVGPEPPMGRCNFCGGTPITVRPFVNIL